ERFGCEYGAKSSPNVTVIPTAQKTGNYDVVFNANVVEIVKDGDKTTGVKYIDVKTGEEVIQSADSVELTSYVLNYAKLLTVSDIGEHYDHMTDIASLGKKYSY